MGAGRGRSRPRAWASHRLAAAGYYGDGCSNRPNTDIDLVPGRDPLPCAFLAAPVPSRGMMPGLYQLGVIAPQKIRSMYVQRTEVRRIDGLQGGGFRRKKTERKGLSGFVSNKKRLETRN